MTKKKLYEKALAIFIVFSMLLSFTVVADAENNGEFQIKLVHTNDIHARVQENAKSGIIGMEKLGSIIDSYTAGADMDLVLDSGDLFHGQPIATLVQGESVAQLAKVCGYDAMTAGNHDWSYGKDRLKELCSIADMTMLTGNVVDDETGNKFFDEEFYTESVTLDGKELKVGIFGVIDPKIKKSTTPSNIEGLTFADSVAYANAAAAELKSQDCDIVIALTHTYSPDELAKQVSGVDLWLAGHEHMQIDEEVTQADGTKTRVIESGYYLYSLSLIEISGTLDDNGNAENLSIEVTPMTYADTSEYQSKESVTAVMNEITAAQAEKLNEKIGSTPVKLDGVWEDLRIDQQNLGNVVTDAYLLETDADVAFENAGGIRASVEAGDVTYGDIIGVSPYGNYVVTKEITGAELKEIMETSFEIQHQCIVANDSGDYEAWPQSSGSYLQFGGMTVTFDPDKEEGSRVLSITVQGEPLDEDELYTVATNNYVAVSSYYPQLAEAEEIGQFTACDEILVRFFKQSDEKIAESINSERLFRKSSDIEWTAGGDGTMFSPYLIGDLETLELFRDNVNSGTDYSGIYFKLTADIDMSGKYSETTGASWTPIGVYVKSDDKMPFNGTLDGDGHKITNLYINAADKSFQAMFGCVGESGTVKNLTVGGTIIGGMGTGGITAMNFGGTLENCCNEADVSGGSYISGIGYNRGGTIKKCTNTGNIFGEGYVSGIATFNENGYIVNCTNRGEVIGTDVFVGGVVAINDYGKVEGCVNRGEVSGMEYVGGITGQNNEGRIDSSSNIASVLGIGVNTGGVAGYNMGEIAGCGNLGKISGTEWTGGIAGCSQSGKIEGCINNETVSGTENVGGISGTNENGIVIECANIGSVKGKKWVGGLLGTNMNSTELELDGEALVENCYNTGTVKGKECNVGGLFGFSDGTVKNGYSTGTVTCDGKWVGGISGENIGVLSNLYYLDGTASGGIDGADVTGVAEKRTANEIADQSTYVDWDFDKIWVMSDDLGRPLLQNLFEISGCGSEKNPYIIDCLEKLEWLGNAVNIGRAYSGVHFKLTADIDMSGKYNESTGKSWTPIGSIEFPFKGVFDGDGHKITGLYIKAPDADCQGLFGYVEENGMIKNLTVSGNVVGNKYVGAVVGGSAGGTILNCVSDGNICGSLYVGGIVGINAGGKVTKCVNNGVVSGSKYCTGGIVGQNRSTVTDCSNTGSVLGNKYVGGIVGQSWHSGEYDVAAEVTGCVNKGSVSGNDSDSFAIGGVVGYTEGGKVSKGLNSGLVSGNETVGGIVGANNGSNISVCYNNGDVTGTKHVGGIVGESYSLINAVGAVENCYNLGQVSGSEDKVGGIVGLNYRNALTNCYNFGQVSGSGIVGKKSDEETISNCYYLDGTAQGGINGADLAGLASAVTAEQFAQQSTFADWDFENIWVMSASLQRPTLKNMYEFTGSGSKESPYLISDLTDLEILRDMVNSGNSCRGAYFKLTADIDMSEKYSETTGTSWTPIGVRENMLMDKNDDEKNKPFAGIFDGNGHKISGLYIYGTDECQGLFGYTADGAVKNLTVSGYVAGKDCIGGIVGWNSAVIENCVNECDVSGAHYDGPTEIISAAAGGISGLNQGKILKSSNIGNVNNEYYAHTNDSVGGISGENWGTVENCYNTGEVSGRFEMGGIAGLNKATIKNCYSTGIISGFYRAGIATENSGVIENSYYLSGSAEKAAFITRNAVKTEAEEKTAEEFVDGTVAYLLQNAQEADADGSVPMVWGQVLTGENADAYPVLTSESAKSVYKVTFTVNDTEYAVAYANPNETVTLPTAPKISGYTFVKWSRTNEFDGEAFTAKTAVTEDMTVYAITKKSSSGGGGSLSAVTPVLSPTASPTPSPTASPTAEPEATDEPEATGEPTVIQTPSTENVFADVSENAWYYNSVKYAFENGLMSGISETEFAPEMDMTRAMFVTVLYRAAGAPDMSKEIWGYPFEDVDSESLYGAAVYWARNNDIVQGYSDEKFAPNESVTREQMAAIIYRYAKLKNYNTELNATLNYVDNAEISDYAKNAVNWCLDNGIMLGNDDNTFAPMANTTRAQAAAVFERIMAE